MTQIELKVDERQVLGKKVRFLRRQGIMPVHLLGHGIESMTLQCDATNLQRVLATAGQTRLISLKLNNEKRPRNVVVREVQRDTVTDEILHVDFYQVQMAEQVKVEVPIVLVGESPAAKLKENTLVQGLNTLYVECLPAKIPTSIELDITSLTQAEQAVRVKDIKLDKEITVLNEPELVVVTVTSRPIEKIEEVVIEEEVVEEEVTAEAPEAGMVREEETKEEPAEG